MEHNLSELEQKWYDKGYQKGLVEGKKLEKEQTVLNLLSMGLEESDIEEVTGISSIEEIQHILNKQQFQRCLKKDPTLLSKTMEDVSSATDIPLIQLKAVYKELSIKSI